MHQAVPWDLGGLGVKNLVGQLCAPFAWHVVRQGDGWTYYENGITRKRRCVWDGSLRGYADYKFLRSGDIVDGPYGREVIP